MPSKTSTSRPRRGRTRRPPTVRGQAKLIRGNPFIALLSTVRRDVDARLRGYLDARLDAVRTHGREVTDMVGAVRDLSLRGGKRLRAALVVAGFRTANPNADLEPAVDAGVALELLHTYFLIHDDWMDGDTVRRGGPAVHTQLSRRFRSRELGAASGILAGDFAAAMAVDALSRVELVPARAMAVLNCFGQMQMDAVLGQQLDVIGSGKNVETTYQLKTGSYTVRGPLRLGALLANASPRILTALDRFAMPVGVAFQLRDDLLGAFGDPEATGKPLGSDLRSGKRTVLLTTALRRARGRDHRLLKSVVGTPRASDAKIRAAIGVLERSGAKAAVEARIADLVTSAEVALRAGRIPADASALLRGAAHALTERGT